MPAGGASPRSPRGAPADAGFGGAGEEEIGSISGAALARRMSRSPSISKLGTSEFRPTMAGAGNRPGGVYDRISSPSSFTGVYRRAWMTDGRLNHFSETGVSSMPSRFEGSTNTRSDEVIHDIRFTLRPNLRAGKGMK